MTGIGSTQKKTLETNSEPFLGSQMVFVKAKVGLSFALLREGFTFALTFVYNFKYCVPTYVVDLKHIFPFSHLWVQYFHVVGPSVFLLLRSLPEKNV